MHSAGDSMTRTTPQTDVGRASEGRAGTSP